MNAFVATVVRVNGVSNQTVGQPKNIARNARTNKVNVEVGNGAIAPKVAIQRAKSQAPVKVEVGNGAIAPKVAIQRAKASQQP
jgi:hypothetical protein